MVKIEESTLSLLIYLAALVAVGWWFKRPKKPKRGKHGTN